MTVRQIREVAVRMLADYDNHRPNEIFAERGTDWLTIEDAYAVQRAVADLRRARGERCVGYKVGCTSPAIQKQLGLSQPVRGYIWQSEALVSGTHLPAASFDTNQGGRFVNLAIEGEIAIRLSHDIATSIASHDDLYAFVDCWFPVIELHNNVFRGLTRTSQELIAGNAMHAGFVAPPHGERLSVLVLAESRIRVEIDGRLVQTNRIAELPDGPLESLRWLAHSLAATREGLVAGDIVLTGSPGALIPANAFCWAVVTCEGLRTELFVGWPAMGKPSTQD
jgi:2-keto-4-pentenoate hydratase